MVYEPNRPDARRAPAVGQTEFEQYEIAQWTPKGGITIAFPVQDIRESGGNRIVERERPYRDGAKLDNTGRKATRWNIRAIFNNTLNPNEGDDAGLGEEGLQINGNLSLYPQVLNELIESFAARETGYLVVPTRGEVSARIESYNRTETKDERDSAVLEMVFVEDNEDSVDAASLGQPSVNATGVSLANSTEFSAQERGAWDGSIQDVKEFLSNVEGLVNAPLEFVRDLRQQVDIIRAAGSKHISSFRRAGTDGRDLFFTPEANKAERRVNSSRDRAGRARSEARRNQPELETVVFENDTSISDIAAQLEIDYEDLLYANPKLDDPSYIPAGTTVSIPNDGAITRQS